MKRLRFIPCQDGTLLNAADVTRVELCDLSVTGWDVRAFLRGQGSFLVGEYATEEAARLALSRLFRHLNGLPKGAESP